MRSFNLLAISALSTAIIAAPNPQSGTGVNDPYYQWSVTGWSAGCVRDCYYDFNVTGFEYGTDPTIPAFSAYCSGSGVGAPFYNCGVFDNGLGNRGLAARLLPAETGTGAHIEVSLQWTDLEQADTYYNLTGKATASYNQFVAPLESFTITPSEYFGVA